MILLLRSLSRSEAKIVLHLQEAGRDGGAEELEDLHVTALSSHMDGSVTNVVLLQHLTKEDLAAHELLKRIQRVVLGADVEDRLVLVVSQLEVLLRAVEVLLEHGHIIVL